MARLVTFMIGGGLILAAAAAVHFSSVDTGQQNDFIRISVLAQSQANYGVDETMTIPAVSMGIIEDKVHDAQENSSVPVILYISLPVEEENAEDSEDKVLDPLENFNHGNAHGKDKDKDNGQDNGKGNGQDKDKDNGKGNGQDKDKDNGKDNGQEKEKDNGKDKDKSMKENNQVRKP